ncbi:MAG: exo-alpha-sialidase, partial [Clostridia bacterium]|nr:exo-alpha-sialidase [Clostridia bacterium]
SFMPPEDIKSNVTVNTQPLSSYSIVVPSNAVTRELNAAKSLQGYFYRTSGIRLPIVTDTEKAVGEHEILLGLTNRTESQQAYAGYLSGAERYAAYNVKSVGNKIVFATFYNPALDTLIPLFAKYYLHTDDAQRPESINITGCELTAELRLTKYNGWSNATNVANPNVFTDDFSGESYWMEESTNDHWTVNGGAYVSSGNGYELTYLHVYEKNSVFSADLKAAPKTAGKGSFGLQLRYTSEYGYVRGGYDYVNGCWFIESREGEDFTAIRVATKAATLTAGQTYHLTLTVENGTAKLAVDGTEILSGSVTQVTPGRIAVFAYDVAVTLDNVNVEFSSGGMGHIIQGIVHTVLPGDAYLEGGSVIELNDGNLHYIHHSGAAFVSTDNGASWETEESWYSGSYASVFRLQNGDLIKTVYSGTDVTIETSKDEGQTWTKTGKICDRLHEGTVALNAGNMNDKMFQSKAGRLLYVQNYESKQYEVINGNTVVVCFEIYYSDDNGATWTRSKTSSYTMPGNSGHRFGEGKIIECEGGVLRCMVSWSTNYDTIVYSESTDGGVTWGAITKMEGFDCGRSSMAIVKDPNGPTDYTYYMVWCYGEPATTDDAMPRSRLALAYTTDGKNWKYMGDIWWWESNYSYNSSSLVNHIVDPFIYVTNTHVIIGTGISERAPYVGETVATTYHYAQRQHIWAVDKDELSAYDEWPEATFS